MQDLLSTTAVEARWTLRVVETSAYDLRILEKERTVVSYPTTAIDSAEMTS